MSARTSPAEQDTQATASGPEQVRRARSERTADGRYVPRAVPRRHHGAPGRGTSGRRPAGVGSTEPTLEQPAVLPVVPRAGPVVGEPGAAGEPGAGLAPSPAAASSAGAGADGGRRAAREARRHRRRVAWACVAVVAACLIATVLVLGVARDRRPPGPTALPSALVPAHHQSQPGASAPEGGDTT